MRTACWIGNEITVITLSRPLCGFVIAGDGLTPCRCRKQTLLVFHIADRVLIKIIGRMGGQGVSLGNTLRASACVIARRSVQNSLIVHSQSDQSLKRILHFDSNLNQLVPGSTAVTLPGDAGFIDETNSESSTFPYVCC